MITIRLFGSLRLKTGLKEMSVYASDVAEVCRLLARATGCNIKEFKKCIFFINGKEAGKKASLSEGDELVVLAPPQGGLAKQGE